jgi:hypothetical protein
MGKQISWVRTNQSIDLYDPPKGLVAEPGSFSGTPKEMAALILQQVETYPETHDQDSFIVGPYWSSILQEKIDSLYHCGTTMCVAGFAETFAHGSIERYSEGGDRAAALLGLSDDEVEALFYSASGEEAVEFLQLLASDESTVDDRKLLVTKIMRY